MDERVKISQGSIMPNVQEMTDLHLKNDFRKSIMHGFHFN